MAPALIGPVNNPLTPIVSDVKQEPREKVSEDCNTGQGNGEEKCGREDDCKDGY